MLVFTTGVIDSGSHVFITTPSERDHSTMRWRSLTFQNLHKRQLTRFYALLQPPPRHRSREYWSGFSTHD